MPNIITHTLFADDVLDALNIPVLNSSHHLFEVGANGPDFLFFHNARPGRFFKKTKLRAFGIALHQNNTNDFYRSCLRSIRREKNEKIRDDMIAYVCGHLCHWALDSTLHPYIFYRTGNCQKGSAADHHRFESMMDAAMLKIKRGQTILDYRVDEQVAPTADYEKRAIARIYVPALAEIFGEEVRPSMIAQSLDDWKATQHLFFDPKGHKAAFFRTLEKPLGLDNMFSGFAVPVEVEDNIDLMNLLHTPWKNPESEQESTQSVLDLYAQAEEKAVEVIRLFLAAIDDAGKEPALFAFLNDANYDMGLPTDLNMHCFDRVDLSI